MSEQSRGAASIWIGLIVLILLAGAGYWGYQQWSQRQTSEPAAPESVDETAPAEMSVSLKENIMAAIETMNTAALEGYMANQVVVVLAASEKGGPVSPSQAVTDLAYLSGATAPWNWNVPAATLSEYQSGAYGAYFGSNTLVGQSANGYVVSFAVDDNGDIATIFMTPSAELLK